MVDSALDAGVPAGWLAADSGYGRDPHVREAAHRRALKYVVEVPVTFTLLEVYGNLTTPQAVHARLKAGVWERRSCGDGAKGERTWDWALVETTVKGEAPSPGFAHGLLIRTSKNKVRRKDGTLAYEFAYFLVHAPHGTTMAEMVQVAGVRWKAEEDNANGKDTLRLDQYQVRTWTPVHRYLTLCMLAYAFLVATRAGLGKAVTPSESDAAR